MKLPLELPAGIQRLGDKCSGSRDRNYSSKLSGSAISQTKTVPQPSNLAVRKGTPKWVPPSGTKLIHDMWSISEDASASEDLSGAFTLHVTTMAWQRSLRASTWRTGLSPTYKNGHVCALRVLLTSPAFSRMSFQP
jgi:hypothetical protein